MLTGDKLETAENIGQSCKLLQKDMIVKRLSNLETVRSFCTDKQIEANDQRLTAGKMMGLLVEAQALKIILENIAFKTAFLKISKTCEAVICCRVSPG
jgi:phospholipid-translocating ATPase